MVDRHTHAPYIHSGLTTSGSMFLVLLCLIPCLGSGVYHYGIYAAEIVGVCVGSAVLTELATDLLFRRLTVRDYSAAVTGMILGLLMPPAVPLQMAALGSAIAIAAGKMLWGGIGRNYCNPAMLAKAVLLIMYPSVMNRYAAGSFDGKSPLILLRSGLVTNLSAMLQGNVSGCIGTGAIILILAGAVLLLLSGTIDMESPLGAILGFAAVFVLFHSHGLNPQYLLIHLTGGSFLFVCFFMLTDYTTSPVTGRGKLWYGILFGALSAAIRILSENYSWMLHTLWSSLLIPRGLGTAAGAVHAVQVLDRLELSDNAVVFALLIINLYARPLDILTMPKPFGTQVRRIIRSEETENQS